MRLLILNFASAILSTKSCVTKNPALPIKRDHISVMASAGIGSFIVAGFCRRLRETSLTWDEIVCFALATGDLPHSDENFPYSLPSDKTPGPAPYPQAQISP